MNQDLQNILELIRQGKSLTAEQKDMVAKSLNDATKELEGTRKVIEAQNRELEIESSLERVRSKTMTMQKSEDLSDAVAIVFEELNKQNVGTLRCGIAILDKEKRSADLWTTTVSDNNTVMQVSGDEPMDIHPLLQGAFNAWLQQVDFEYILKDSDLNDYYKALTGVNFKLPESQYLMAGNQGICQYYYNAIFPSGGLFAFRETAFPDDAKMIMKRFANVFEQTYTRFLDLQKAEAQTRQAIRQASLDRIRAEIASMRTKDDLEKITPLIWKELTVLGIPFIRCGVFIMDDSQELIHTFLSTPGGKAIAAFHLPYSTPGNISRVLSHWRNKTIYTDNWKEEDLTEFADTLVKQGAVASAEQYLHAIPRGGFYLHFLPFLQGMLYVGNTEKLTEDEMQLVQPVAGAFATAYARYDDFNRLEAAKKIIETTLADLKQAQAQLIQSEKMASLGQLTAGIAHEIQNPLNFVNNFSEVSNELVEEMMNEANKGNTEEVKIIAKDIKQNLEKINHHGKRADAIVKGMLQHSRTSTSQKEPTDINALADEYLRLAYHGLRGKDKSFTASLNTEFDETIGKINIVPQDIGRVLLNLYNNAFYAVNEKKKQGTDGYAPAVSVTVKTMEDKPDADWVEIKVQDNGHGIPENIIDKIFQPFFTTKPTGQGTGLGLSLAYDIVKAHGGELKVESRGSDPVGPGGAVFIIRLRKGDVGSRESLVGSQQS